MLLLPHGHEGQGPDHTSGRIERFLQLCAEGSMTVARAVRRPANYFHLLRRHVLDGVHRPMVVFTPKSMLRNKRGRVARVADFTDGRFQPVIDDPRYREHDGPAAGVAQVLLSSGKLYCELDADRDKRQGHHDDTAIVRLEQLYPVPRRKLAAVLERYPNADDVRWVQEEPANQGAWPFFGPGAAGEAAGPALGHQARVAARAWRPPPPGRRRCTRSSRPTSSTGRSMRSDA